MKRQGLPTSALYVRLPVGEARKLDRAAEALSSPKKDLVAELIAQYVDPDTPEGLERLRELRAARVVASPRRVVVEDDDGGLVVGRHAFQPAEPPEVLTPAQAAGLLQIDEPSVVALAEEGRVPAQQIAGQWRFSRQALLAWLSGSAIDIGTDRHG